MGKLAPNDDSTDGKGNQHARSCLNLSRFQRARGPARNESAVGCPERATSYVERMASPSRDMALAREALGVVLRRLAALPVSPEVEELRERAESYLEQVQAWHQSKPTPEEREKLMNFSGGLRVIQSGLSPRSTACCFSPPPARRDCDPPPGAWRTITIFSWRSPTRATRPSALGSRGARQPGTTIKTPVGLRARLRAAGTSSKGAGSRLVPGRQGWGESSGSVAPRCLARSVATSCR